jgi:hypothetical protein
VKRLERVKSQGSNKEEKESNFFVVYGSGTDIWNQGGEYLLLSTESTSSRYTTQGANRLRVSGEREGREEGRGERENEENNEEKVRK